MPARSRGAAVMAGSKGATRSGAASAEARKRGASAERIVGASVCRGQLVGMEVRALPCARNVVDVVRLLDSGDQCSVVKVRSVNTQGQLRSDELASIVSLQFVPNRFPDTKKWYRMLYGTAQVLEDVNGRYARTHWADVVAGLPFWPSWCVGIATAHGGRDLIGSCRDVKQGCGLYARFRSSHADTRDIFDKCHVT